MDDHLLENLKRQIEAEQEKAAELRRQNDLAEKTLQVLQRTLTSEQNRLRFWADISEKTAALVAALPELILQMHGQTEKLDGFGEMLEVYRKEDSRRLARLEYALILLLQGKGNGNKGKADALLKDLEQSRLRELLQEHLEMLHELELKRARFGDLNTPPHLLLQIEDLRQEIENLKNRISGSGREL